MRTYPGGKNGSGVWQRIISQQPPHDEYIEPFLGSGAVLRRKLPARATVGVDVDPHVAKQWLESWREWLPGCTAAGSAAAGGGGPMFQMIEGDGVSYLQGRMFGPRTLIYLDPPYLRETRSCQRRMYRCELDVDGHEAMLARITELGCAVQLSGYWTEMYARALRTWRCVKYATVVRSGAVREECLWMNYPEPGVLHDARYVGAGYEERWKYARKRRRWLKRLAGMDVLERAAMLQALNESGLLLRGEGRAKRPADGESAETAEDCQRQLEHQAVVPGE